MLVAVEGPTGVGKTTLVQRLQTWLEVTAVLDPFEANPFIAETYRPAAESARRGVVVELTFLGLRVDQLRRIDRMLNAGQSVLTDWSMAKQPIFASLTLDRADQDRIAPACALWDGDLPVPDLIVYLRADVATLAERIFRRGRPMEAAITASDLDALCTAYDTALTPAGDQVAQVTQPNTSRTVLIVDAARFDVFDDDQVADLAARIQHALPGSDPARIWLLERRSTMPERLEQQSDQPIALRPERTEQAERTLAGHACRRLLFTAPGHVELIEEDLPALRTGEVYARTVVTGISHGTEMAWLRGQAAALHRTWDPKQRVYRDGAGRAYPVAPGYETVAIIDEVAPGTDTRLEIGDLVYLDRPHADGHIIDASTAGAGLLPRQVSAEAAVFWPLARVALGGIHDTAIQLGETVVVVGLGTVGLLAAQLAFAAGARCVVGIDRYQRRLDLAAALGVHAIPATGTDGDLAADVRQATGTAGADAAIEASGSYAGLHEAIRACRLGGRVATVASYHGEQPGLRLGEEYHRNRITLISSMTVNGCPQRGHPAWDLDRLNATARELVTTGALVVEPLITHRVPFTDAAEAYDLITSQPENTIKVVLTYDD